MRLDASWRREFLRRTLSKGMDYFIGGEVSGIEGRDGGWVALVGDADQHEVYVPAVPLPLDGMRCDCQHNASAGDHCEHLAGACLAIEAYLKTADLARGGRANTPEEEIAELEHLVTYMPEADVRAFLLQVLLDDASLCEKFLQKYV